MTRAALVDATLILFETKGDAATTGQDQALASRRRASTAVLMPSSGHATRRPL